MAVEVPSSKANDTNSTESSTFHKSSIFLLIRSYEDARNVLTFILTISAVVIILGIIVSSVISYLMLRKKRYNRNGSNFVIMHLCMVELLYRFLVFLIIVILYICHSDNRNNRLQVQSYSVLFKDMLYYHVWLLGCYSYRQVPKHCTPFAKIKVKEKAYFTCIPSLQLAECYDSVVPNL